MSREINFANVNVSIQEFQKLSKGDYNAGEVKLSSETKLTKINNHVHLLRANNKTLSHTEIMVIKDAFIRALSDNGVTQAEINRVRKEIGLAPADSHDTTLAERSLRPLSRQQIRRILDRNAAAINAHTGAETIQTSAQMYGNMSVGKSERLRAKREAAFDSTEARRTLTENRNIALYQRTLVGDTDFLSQADREFALTCAKSQRDLILRNSNNNPSAERECELVFLTQSGAHVSVASGASETETLRRLDEQILRLTNSPAPSDEIIAMRNELLAVGAHSPTEHKNRARSDNWLRGVGYGEQANQRGRTALVILLQERGINDFKTLSLVNRLQPAFVQMALDSLLNRYGYTECSGDALRNTPLMGLLVENGADYEQVTEQEATYIPVLSPEVRNEAIANMLISDEPQRFIMNDFAKMAGECHAEAVAHFGADFAAMTDSVHGLADDAAIRAFCDAETVADREVTADSLRATFRDSSIKSGADKFVADAFKPLLQEAGNKSVDASAKELVGALKNMHPALQQQLIDAGNPAAAREVLNGLADEMRGMAQHCTTVAANNAAVIDSLGKGSMSQLFAKALIAAVDEAGFAALPLAEKISLFAQNKDLGVQLRDACKAQPANVELQPHNLKEIAAGLLDAMDKTGLRTRLDAYNAYRGIVEEPAIAAGYNKSEISSLCDTFRLYKGATGCSDEEALRTVLNTQSDARRLYGFGGRFTSSVENFSKGLHLQEQFRDWFSATVDVINAHKDNEKAQFPAGSSVTAINGEHFFMNEKTSFAVEKFIFDEIASNAALPLEHEDPEQVFGMANNPATRLVARGYVISSVQTLLQIPPQIRGVVYKVLDVVHPIRQNPDEPLQKTFHSHTPTFLARIIRHLDEIQTMQANGTLTYENFINLAFSEVPDAVNKSMYDVMDWYTLHIIQDVIPNQLNGDMAAIPTLLGAMNSSGCSLAEAIEAVREHRTMPSLPYMASVATGLNDVNGNWSSGRNALIGDMVRPINASIIRTGEAAIPSENAVFTVGFPDGTTLKTRHNNVSKEDTQASAEAIADKVEQFVGGSHPDQLNAVLFNLSQSGMAAMREGLVSYGIYSTEHAPMTYILSQDQTTGTINIHYQQPEGFPIKYHWDTEVTLDGTSISTPMVVEGSV